MDGYESAVDKLAEWYFDMNFSELSIKERFRMYYMYNAGIEMLMLVFKKPYHEIHNDAVNAAAARYNK